MWYIAIPFVLILSGAVIYAVTSPKEYRSATLILVTPQKVPEAFIRPTVTSKIEDRLQSIGQEIMSRTRLEQLISALKLYPEETRSKSKEEVYELMRKDIHVEIKGKEGYFTISYIGKDPRVVTTVTNKLASLFIEENLKLREQQAQGTSEFLVIELNATKVKLEEQEKTVTHFKRQFMGELPEQRESNLKVLEQLQFQSQRIGENIRAAHDRKLIIQKQLADTELLIASSSKKEESPLHSSSPIQTEKVSRTVVRDPLDVQLGQMNHYLIDLQSKYTVKHPDLMIVQKRIAELEARIEKERSEKEAAEKNESESNIATTPLSPPKIVTKKEEKEGVKLNPRYKEMESQLIATELEISRLKEEEEKGKGQIMKYRERIENTPLRELAMANLTRDYQNTKELYQTLLKKSEEAQQAENLERRQKGEQFKVIDPGRIPEKPFRPDIPKILLFGILIGLGSGFGLAFFREQMDRSFRDAEDLETTMGFKVLANIPTIQKEAA
ncbi:MAG: GNVR domain-containing protein [Deltaproteobacteria bacterium]|nr:GNVR domain-containing protein [Deltaproteobacteria bacterium]